MTKQKENMARDPAVQKAQLLWQQKNPKEAMLVLTERISELNGQLERQKKPKRRTLTWLVIGIIIISIVLIFYYETSSYDKEVHTSFLKIHYSSRCVGYVSVYFGIEDGRELYDGWASRLVDDHREAAEACENVASLEPMFECLQDHYVSRPLG